jgi:hypothetical protein
MSSLELLRVPSRRDGIWLGALPLAVALMFGVGLIGPPQAHHDLWHQMEIGTELFQSGRLPVSDSVEYTLTLYPVVPQEWGAGLVGLVLTMVGSGDALMYFYVFLPVAISSLLALRLAIDSVPLLSCPLGALVPVGIGVLSAPPLAAQAYSDFACALLLCLLRRDESGDRPWIALWLVACAAWGNLLGELVVGPRKGGH